MRRKICLFILITGVVFVAFTQDNVKKDSSYDSFISQSGVIIKLQDFRLPPMEGSGYSTYDNRIRILLSNDIRKYFHQITKTSKTGDIIGSIELKELLEMVNAVNLLQTQFNEDITKSIEYMENKYITDDGIQVGYYISTTSKAWFIKLDKYKTDSLIFFKESKDILKGFQEAINKIEEIKRN